jgi:xanthine dehydrogenase accessory factor
MQPRHIISNSVVPAVGLDTDQPTEILRYAAASMRAGLATALVTLVEIRGGSARPTGS